MPFAYYFEWVDHDDVPADPEALAQPFLYPCVARNPALEAIAKYRVDETNTWHILDWNERPAMYAERYER